MGEQETRHSGQRRWGDKGAGMGKRELCWPWWLGLAAGGVAEPRAWALKAEGVMKV